MSLLLALTGSAGPTNYTITALAGSYSVAGQSAGVAKSKLVTALAGSYAVTGAPAGINYAPSAGYTITAASGSYVVSGNPANITYTSSRTETYSGGYDLPTGRRKTKKEVYAERVRLGIIKEDIERKAVEVVAKAQKTVSFIPVYQQDPQKLVRELMAQLRLKVPSPDYSRAIEIAIRAAEQDEEDTLILLAS